MPAGAAGKIETARATVNKDTSETLALSNTNSFIAGGIVVNGGTVQLQQRAKSDEFTTLSGTLQSDRDAGVFEKKKIITKQNRQLIEIIIRSTPREK
jgi:autotransporter-associated beta strand protein